MKVVLLSMSLMLVGACSHGHHKGEHKHKHEHKMSCCDKGKCEGGSCDMKMKKKQS